MKTNEAGWDRIVRAVIGLALIGLGLAGLVSGVWLYIFYIAGGVLLLTALTGFCPLYALFKVKTRK